MNYYKHYMGDYQRDTGHLSLAQDGAYRRMMDHYYSTEQALPSDLASLYRICGAMDKKEREAVKMVADSFFTLGDDKLLHHDRIDEEIGIAQQKISNLKANAASGGKKSGETRRSKSEANASHKNEANALENAEANAKANGTKNANNTNNQYPVNTNPPIPPKGGESRKRKSAVALKTYVEECRTSGVKPIPESDTVFEYAEKAGIPTDFLWLHWKEFLDRYKQPDAKRYKDWPSVFRKSVRGNWFRLWYVDQAGQYALTTQGIQAKKTHGERAA